MPKDVPDVDIRHSGNWHQIGMRLRHLYTLQGRCGLAPLPAHAPFKSGIACQTSSPSVYGLGHLPVQRSGIACLASSPSVYGLGHLPVRSWHLRPDIEWFHT